MTGTVLCAVAGFLAAGLFFSTNALATGFLLRIGAGAPALGVVELGPDGGVGAELLILVEECPGGLGASDGAMVRAAGGSSGVCGLVTADEWIELLQGTR